MRENYTICRPLSIRRLFFLACIFMSVASSSSFLDVEVRKLEVSLFSLDVSKLFAMLFIASVVLCMVSDASFAVLMIMFTTVFACERNFALPARTNPDAALQIIERYNHSYTWTAAGCLLSPCFNVNAVDDSLDNTNCKLVLLSIYLFGFDHLCKYVHQITSN